MSTTTPSFSVRKKRSSFSLSSFRKPAPPAPAARPISIGDVVIPTKRPTPQQRLPPDHPMQLPASAAAAPKDRRLHTHMADVVDPLQQKQKSNPQCEEVAEDEKVTFTPVAPVAHSHGIHPSTPVSSALHKFFSKVSFISSIMKSSKNSAPASRVLEMPNEAPPDTEVNDQEDKQYHYHHYIHHHHHHHHYGHSPDKEGAVLGRHRRHSESSEAIHPYMPRLWKAEEDEDDDEVESPIETFLDACSTRHSESVIRRKDEVAMMGELVIKSSLRQRPTSKEVQQGLQRHPISTNYKM